MVKVINCILLQLLYALCSIRDRVVISSRAECTYNNCAIAEMAHSVDEYTEEMLLDDACEEQGIPVDTQMKELSRMVEHIGAQSTSAPVANLPSETDQTSLRSMTGIRTSSCPLPSGNFANSKEKESTSGIGA